MVCNSLLLGINHTLAHTQMHIYSGIHSISLVLWSLQDHANTILSFKENNLCITVNPVSVPELAGPKMSII